MLIAFGLALSFIVTLIITVVFSVIYSAIQYVFDSIFLNKVLKKKNGKGSILAWIPYYNKVMLGKLVEKELVGWIIFVMHMINVGLIFLLCYMYKFGDSSFLEINLLLILVMVIIIFVLNMVIFHGIMKRVTVKYVDLLVIFNVFTLGIFRSIILFMVRDNDNIISVSEKS